MENRRWSSKRVRVEHAIGGMKFFHCLGIRFRNYIDSFRDTVICLAAGSLEGKASLLINKL
ncbi:hypothetical protein [Methylococcus geothermalis]|uniref:hypothetical protein n=1 Tax=Methylococcus geothermalis TaxID=2681310 RepID=UPI00389951CC